MEPDRENHIDWFVTEVEPHRPALKSWLHARFRTLPDIDNIVQDALARVLKARAAGPVRSPRALLFTTARNLALDLHRRNGVLQFQSIEGSDDFVPMDRNADVIAAVIQQEDLALLNRAIQALPERARQVLTLRTAYGLSQRQIATRLRLSESSVEKYMAQAVRRCTEFFKKET